MPLAPLVIGVVHSFSLLSLVFVVPNFIWISFALLVVGLPEVYPSVVPKLNIWYEYFGIHTKYDSILSSGIISPLLYVWVLSDNITAFAHFLSSYLYHSVFISAFVTVPSSASVTGTKLSLNTGSVPFSNTSLYSLLILLVSIPKVPLNVLPC